VNDTSLRLPDPYSDADLTALAERCGSPLLVLDCARLRRQYRRLAAALPGVEIHYAVKALSHPAVIKTLAAEGSSFDLATTAEAVAVRGLGVSGNRCIHTHPVKRDADIRAALELDVRTFVADSIHELAKFVPYRDRCEVLLRVAFRSPGAAVDLSAKFGCLPSDVPALIAAARDGGVRMVGLATHAGSQPKTTEVHVRAIRCLVDLLARVRHDLAGERPTLDIGGGFPTEYGYGAGGPTIEAFCAPLRDALVGAPPDTRFLCEPGRYLVAPAGTAVASVIGKAERDGRWWYYLDDGVYGSWSGQLHEPVRYPVRALGRRGATYPSVLAGPTCDSVDVIGADLELPLLEPGDLIAGETMGAYTAASACDFNGVPRARIVVVNEEAPA
jgi:ornithine decarboxylase